MQPVTTNIFCIMGNPGSGKYIILQNLLDDKEFISKYNISKFVYGTTRPMKTTDIEGITYHFFTKEEYDNLNSAEIIESRSYDNVNTGDIYYYFTLLSHITYGSNNIGKVSLFQYDELKKWAFKSQLKNPMHRINLYPIMINASIFEREKRMINRASNDNDIYEMCAKLLSERYEFDTVLKANPEIIDNLNPNTCIIDNSKSNSKQNITLIIDKIESFILEKMIPVQGN